MYILRVFICIRYILGTGIFGGTIQVQSQRRGTATAERR